MQEHEHDEADSCIQDILGRAQARLGGDPLSPPTTNSTVDRRQSPTVLALLERLDKRVTRLEGTVAQLTKPRIYTAACEVLQIAGGDQQQLGSSNAATRTGTMADSNNRVAHCTSLAALDHEVAEVVGMITDEVRATCQQACWVVEHYEDIKLAFRAAFHQATTSTR